MKNPIFDIDNWKEITATLARNKIRTFLTAFGIFWGTAMLAMLWGGAQGMQRMLRGQFEGFATNSAIIASSRTSMPYKGYKKGMYWSLTQTDIDNIRHSVSDIKAMSAVSNRSASLHYGTKSYEASVQGVESAFPEIFTPVIYSGRFINEADERDSKKVCCIGKRVAGELFGSTDPLGKFIEVNNIYYRVVGVVGQESEVQINGDVDNMITIPLSTMRKAYNLGTRVDMALIDVKSGHSPAELQPQIERIIRLSHPIHPDDKRAIMYMDISEEFDMIDKMFTGVDVLVLFVGFGSLLAGIIGVGNIMWIIVKERTQEIGIRRAIGAKPRDIIMQVLSESIVLTVIAGIAGICFASGILAIAEMITPPINEEPLPFQLTFYSAIIILVVFLTLGTAAGTIPAIKAMRIKPIEALNDK